MISSQKLKQNKSSIILGFSKSTITSKNLSFFQMTTNLCRFVQTKIKQDYLLLMITHSETLKWEKSLPVTVTPQGEKNANVKKLPSCILYFPRIWYTGVRVFQVALRCVGRIFPTGGIGRRVSPNQLKIGYSPLPGKIPPPPKIFFFFPHQRLIPPPSTK